MKTIHLALLLIAACLSSSLTLSSAFGEQQAPVPHQILKPTPQFSVPQNPFRPPLQPAQPSIAPIPSPRFQPPTIGTTQIAQPQQPIISSDPQSQQIDPVSFIESRIEESLRRKSNNAPVNVPTTAQGATPFRGPISAPAVVSNIAPINVPVSQNAAAANSPIVRQRAFKVDSDGLGFLQADNATLPVYCTFFKPIRCDPNFPYRTLDGSCNNLKNLWWGKAHMPYARAMQPAYADGVSAPRRAADGSELPNPPELSCSLHSDSYEIEPFVTNLFMQWGQLVNHDTTSVSVSRDEEKDLSSCKTCTRTEKCMPMMLNPSDRCGTKMNHACFEFARATSVFADTECRSNVREQMNMITAFLDGSAFYGSSDEELEKLRDRRGFLKGQLLKQMNGLLPAEIEDSPSDCIDFTKETKCFKAGDDRVNQNPGLSSIQTLFLREHNRIATIFTVLNPTWSDDKVFQETRRLVIAIMQHITYHEYVPLLLGRETVRQLGIEVGVGSQYSNSYDPNVDPRILNEYAAGAGRFGHSMVRNSYSRLDRNFSTAGSQSFMLRNNFFRAHLLYDSCQGGLEAIMRGFLRDPLMKIDSFVSDDLTKHLFESFDDLGHSFHFDLVSINIQRGREAGIPSYTRVREFCGLTPIRSWEDMSLVMPSTIVNTFRQFYRFAEDVDLFSAMLAENKEEGLLIGPTVKCIVGLQFKNMRNGDRFWYETNQAPARFTPQQLGEIRKSSLAKLMCRNLRDTPQIQPLAMLSTKFPNNTLVDCASLPDFTWAFWRE